MENLLADLFMWLNPLLDDKTHSTSESLSHWDKSEETDLSYLFHDLICGSTCG